MKLTYASLLSCFFISCASSPAAVIGESCQIGDCAENLQCVASFENGVNIPGNVCTTPCIFDTECVNNAGAPSAHCAELCEEGSTCLNYTATGEKYCYSECVDDRDCRPDEGWLCENIDFFGTIKACIPALE